MNKFKRFIYDLIHPKEWMIVYNIKNIIWKIKDYDRLEYDYSNVLCHATNSTMSKTWYDLNTIYVQIDKTQSESYYDIVKSDINDILNTDMKSDDKIADIIDYIDKL